LLLAVLNDNCLFIFIFIFLRIVFISAGAYVGSVINLAAISIERYLKVVHNVWAKQNLRDWVIYSTVAFSWIAGTVCALAVVIPTTGVVHGVCLSRMFFKSPAAEKVYGVWNVVSFYVIILLIFVYCYGRILVVVRRQARVMAAHGGGHGSNTAQVHLNKIQTSVIKTMILVYVTFATSTTVARYRSLLPIKHRSGPVEQDPDQRHQDHDPRQRAVRRNLGTDVHLQSA